MKVRPGGRRTVSGASRQKKKDKMSHSRTQLPVFGRPTCTSLWVGSYVFPFICPVEPRQEEVVAEMDNGADGFRSYRPPFHMLQHVCPNLYYSVIRLSCCLAICQHEQVSWSDRSNTVEFILVNRGRKWPRRWTSEHMGFGLVGHFTGDAPVSQLRYVCPHVHHSGL